RGPYATDAQHVSVEFIHPVIVGKRALPALDVSAAPLPWIEALAGPHDMVMAFGPPEHDPQAAEPLAAARARGAMTIGWPFSVAHYAVESPACDTHVHQELFELLGHTLYESVHVFLEHLSQHETVPGAGFLYPFLGGSRESDASLLDSVAASVGRKCADAGALRTRVAGEQLGAIAAAVHAVKARIELGGRILAFGNGGSATDATDFALDCICADGGWAPVPALSLALEPAVITATANDVGADLIFLRQLIAQSKPHDVAFAFSTSGGSRNIVAALEEAKRRGLLTIALLGYDGGEVVRRALADIAIVVPSDDIPRIQEAQGTIYHVIREALGNA
ncbi:MAG: SIS domain-containing protein, partial [Candidatus Baltobacteraceae bacterium]